MAITFRKVNFIYSEGTPFAYHALKDVDLSFAEKKITAIVGATGSGKSTMVQHLNALLIPTEGEVEAAGHIIKAKEKNRNLKDLRKHVGLVFQFPEYQLFEETILKDVAFGPKNFGCSEEEASARAKEALKTVGIGEDYYERSPLDLSGGQKRRVAIAGILAMKPEVLVLDEPTAGLDPAGTKAMMDLFVRYNREAGNTVILVTHNMDQVLEYCDEVVLVKDGRIMTHTDTKSFFRDPKNMEDSNMNPPSVIRFEELLREKGFKLDGTYTDLKELAKALAREVKR